MCRPRLRLSVNGPAWHCQPQATRLFTAVTRRSIHTERRAAVRRQRVRVDLTKGRMWTDPDGLRMRDRSKVTLRDLAAKPPITIEEYRELVSRGIATVGHANILLYHTAARLKKLPLPERKKSCANQNVGATVLHWLWSQPREKHDAIILQNGDRTFSDLLTWMLIGEGRLEIMYQWIEEQAKEIDNDPPPADPWKLRDHGHYNVSRLLGDIANGLVQWEGGGMTEAFLFFDRVWELLGRWSLFHGRIGYFMALRTTMSTAFMKPLCPPYDPQAFDRLLDRFKCIETPKQVANDEAIWSLYHPTEPSAWPLLQNFLDPDRPQVWNPASVLVARLARRRHLAVRLRRGAYIFQHQGENHYASELESRAQIFDPEGSNDRHLRCIGFQDLHEDPRLAGVRQQSQWWDYATALAANKEELRQIRLRRRQRDYKKAIRRRQHSVPGANYPEASPRATVTIRRVLGQALHPAELSPSLHTHTNLQQQVITQSSPGRRQV